MPDFPPIVERENPPALALTTHISGGSSKSTSATFVADAAWRSERELIVFQNDRQSIFDAYGKVDQIALPPTEEVVHNPLADILAHKNFDEAVRSAGDNATLLYDCAAAALNRHSFTMDMLNIADRLAAMGRYCAVLVPLSARLDIARESLATYDVWRRVFPPPHVVVPVVFFRDGDGRSLPHKHDFWRLIERAEDGVLVQPRIPIQILDSVRLSGMRLGELADTRDPLISGEIAKKINIAPTIVELMRRAIGDALAEFDPQMQRLGFQLGL